MGGKKYITWQNPIDIEEYTKTIREMANELIRENRKLKKVHSDVIREVNQLMNIDLLRNEPIWKDKANTVKVMVEQETKHRPANNCKLWLFEINNQIYKSLEYQYRVGLENLNENLPPIEADLVLKTDVIEFRPSFDFLKEKYYHEIQRFITFPLKFNGVGGEGKAVAMFRKMPEENSKYMQTVYIKAEDLFDQLKSIETEYLDWTVLG